MSDLALIAGSTKTKLLEIAKQASALGTALQNAAPGDKSGVPNNSIQYLLTTSDKLTHLADECSKVTSEK